MKSTEQPSRMLLYRLAAIGAGLVAAELAAWFWPEKWLPNSLVARSLADAPVGRWFACAGIWLVLLFVAAKLLTWLVAWAYQIVLQNGLQRLTGERPPLPLWLAILLAPVVLPVAAVVLIVQLVAGAGQMLAAVGRWQWPERVEDLAEDAPPPPESSPGRWLLHFGLGLGTLAALAVGVPMLLTVVPPLHVPVRVYGIAALSLILLLAPAMGFWRRWRSKWPEGPRLAVSLARTLAGVALAGVLVAILIGRAAAAGQVAEGGRPALPPLLPTEAVGDETFFFLEWACRIVAGLLVAGGLVWGLVRLLVFRNVLSRPPAPRVRQFMADRLFRKKRIAVFSVLAVTMAVAMELIGVGVTNGMLAAVKDASRRVLADVVMEGPMEGIAWYDEFIADVRDVTVDVDGRPVKAVAAVTPTIAGWGVARFQLGVRRTYPVRVMGIRLNPDQPLDSQYDGVTRFDDGLLLRPHGPNARPRFDLPDEWKALLSRRGQPIRPGCIPGYEVLPGEKTIEQLRGVRGAVVVLSTIPITELDAANVQNMSFAILDFHKSGVYEFDSRHFYVDFDKAQELFAMTALRDVEGELVRPAMCSRILFRIEPSVDIDAAQQAIAARWQRFLADPRHTWPANETVQVETWMARQRSIIGAFEQQKVLFILVFAVISIVAGFLIMAIFIMIVSEKTRDIGILKSLGASDGDVLRTFLSFALVIGVVGSAIGLGIASVFLHYINPIKDWAGDMLGTKIFGDDVWLFNDLPTSLEPGDVLMILVGSVAISVLAAYIPARRAAKLPPVRALSYE